MGWTIKIILVLMIAILAGIILFLIIEDRKDILLTNNLPSFQEELQDNYLNNTRPHWTHMPLTYKIKTDYCTNFTARRIRWAFEALQNETQEAVSFIEVKDDYIIEEREINKSEGIAESHYNQVLREGVDILIECSLQAPEQGEYWTQAEASPITIGENRLTAGYLHFYNVGENRYSGGCLHYPLTELHEILHLFGFEHTEEGIMSPISYGCVQFKIDDYIIEDLHEIYYKRDNY